jgi:hypothetical protein
LLALPEIKNEIENLITRIFSLAIARFISPMIYEAYLPLILSLVNYTIAGEIQFLRRIFL